MPANAKGGGRGERLALAGLVVVTIGFAWVAQRFANRGAWGGSLLASVLALALGLYVVLRVWPQFSRPDLAYRFSRQGVLFILAILAVSVAALASANNLLFLILAAMLAALLVWQEVPVRLLLRHLKSWMPSFSIWLRADLPGSEGPEGHGGPPEIYFPMIAGGKTGSAVLSLQFPRRGIYRQDAFWLRSGFPFGFLMKSARLRLPREILVYPSVVPKAALQESLPRLAGQWERLLAGLGQDLYRIRPYQTGDSSRVIHWKATAHTGDLKVREFTLEEDRRIEIVFDRSIPHGSEWPPRFERAVELCASLVWKLHTMGAGTRFHGEPPEGPRGGREPEWLENVYDILKFLALVEAIPGGQPVQVEPGGLFQVIFTALAAGLPSSLPEASYHCYRLADL
ncbi:MAG: DUF58 domain-containing protein [Acidobacteria bacterium]|nr:DUF58 domain-containing protein [Acidobacteriota bacterium]